MGTFRQSLYGSCIFCRSHSRYLFKLSGKIMNRGISQKIGNLGEIHVIIPDQLTGKINFHSGKKFNGSTLILFPKKFLKLRTSNKIVVGDFFNGKALVDMIFHVVDDPATERRFCVAGIIQTGRY